MTVAEVRAEPGPSAREAADAGIRVLPRTVVRATGGRHGIRWADLAPLDSLAARERIAVDAVAVSGGWSPAVHLFSQSGGKLRWDDDLAAFVPAAPQPAQQLAGALRGDTTLAEVLISGHRAGLEPRPRSGGASRSPRRVRPRNSRRRRRVRSGSCRCRTRGSGSISRTTSPLPTSRWRCARTTPRSST